ncbi:VOC family protein [Piscinibacter sp. XHJ-5]|uniref:VOC family protein n=1 Tax=Piscinibacter sp. XHJ-5 TaxID=3037797 RepID=UPI002452A360|nr:VOC family protein [Piscinibacter sp. XHJ-5]
MSYLHGKFIWFEHVSDDPAKARAFYEPLFGWHVEGMPMGDQRYEMIHNGSDGIGGLMKAQPGEPTAWRSYISVEDIAASYQAALAAGARGVMPPTPFGPVGVGASLVDPTGAAVSLWHSADADRPDPERIPIGDWYWDELWTPDARKAVTFYEQALGYIHTEMNMGDQGTYFLLHAGGKPRAGVFQSPPDKAAPPMWLPYVHVADCDATAAKAAELGGHVFMPPTDVPDVGRIAAMFDPQGAPIAFIRSTPAQG